MGGMKIEWLPSSAETVFAVDKPVPAKSVLPDWYMEMTYFAHGASGPEFDGKNLIANKTAKACDAYGDALRSGYVQVTHADMQVERDGDSIVYRSARGPSLCDHRPHVSIPIGPGYYPLEMVWHQWWVPKLPPGYSMLLTHPLGRMDLPFVTLTGVVDSDVFFHTPAGNVPFYIREEFEGVIPAGTPIYQMIPFRRDDWTSEFAPFDMNAWGERAALMQRKFWGQYRRLFHKKKSYK